MQSRVLSSMLLRMAIMILLNCSVNWVLILTSEINEKQLLFPRLDAIIMKKWLRCY